ncbi:MAG: hypothetical protein ACJ8C4_01945 [Gemmataceae bacterium]
MTNSNECQENVRKGCATLNNGSAIVIENIEHMRREAGIDDQELHEEIQQLNIGDLVQLTLLAGDRTVEMVTVRISAIRNATFAGTFANLPADARLQRLPTGTTLNFTADHIHSIHKVTHAEDHAEVRPAH